MHEPTPTPLSPHPATSTTAGPSSALPGPFPSLLAAALAVLALVTSIATTPGSGGPPHARTVEAGAADRARTAVLTADSAWTPPIPGADPADVRRGFAAPPQPWGRGHRGVDLAAGSGTVLAPAPATVRFSGAVVGRGVLTLAHDDGTLSSFEPVEALVPVGARVEAGEPIAVVAPTAVPHCLLPCVHWGVRRPDGWLVGGSLFDRYLDPLLLLGWSGPSVLWPREDGD